MAVINFLLKTLLNLFILVLILALFLVGLAVWSVPKLGPKVIDSWIEGKTGFSTTINSLDLKLFSGSLNIEGIALINPPYYQSKNFMQIRQISMQVNPKSLYKDRTVFEHIFVDVDKFTWVKNAQGAINIKEFSDKFKSKASPAPLSSVEEKEAPKESNLLTGNYIIRKLIIRIGEIDTIGFPLENDAQSFVLNYSKEFTDVTNIETVTNQLVKDFSVHGAFKLIHETLQLPLPSGGTLETKVAEKIQKNVEKAFRYLKKVAK